MLTLTVVTAGVVLVYGVGMSLMTCYLLSSDVIDGVDGLGVLVVLWVMAVTVNRVVTVSSRA